MTSTEQTQQRRKYYSIGLEIEKRLHEGQYTPGQKLPSERELSEVFDTSRAIIREAIIMLELKNLVEVRQGAGIFFKASAGSQSTEMSEFDALAKVIGPFELLQAREVLETSIVEFAARNIKLNELQELRGIIRRQEQTAQDDNDQFEQLDREFHLRIAEATQNRMLIATAKRLWNVVRTENPLWNQLNMQYLQKPQLKEQWLNEHKRLFAALQKRDPLAAREVMLEHLTHSKAELMKIVEQGGNEDLTLDDFFFASQG